MGGGTEKIKEISGIMKEKYVEGGKMRDLSHLIFSPTGINFNKLKTEDV